MKNAGKYADVLRSQLRSKSGLRVIEAEDMPDVAANALAGEGVTIEFIIGAVIVAAGVQVASGLAFPRRAPAVATG